VGAGEKVDNNHGEGGEEMSDECECEGCGCIGNANCGAEPVDNVCLCALNQCGFCSCCCKLGVEANKARWTRGGKK